MRHASLVVSLLVLFGCGTNNSSTVLPKPPLQASLLPPTHGVGFYVSRDAYVAIFDIAPGRGIGLFYPHVGRELDDAVEAGPRWVSNSIPYMNASYRTPLLNPVHYLFLVASREPLKIDDYVGYDDHLREKLSPATFTGNAYTAMKALIDEVVPTQPPEDWATALYIVYGGDNRGRGARIYRLVYCANNQFYWVALDRMGFACPAPSDSTSAGKQILEEQGKEKLDRKTIKKTDILAFDPLNAPSASDLLRRPVTRIDPVPMPPEPRSMGSQSSSSSRRLGPVLGTGASTGAASTPSSGTVETPAQPPSNPRGRVTDNP